MLFLNWLSFGMASYPLRFYFFFSHPWLLPHFDLGKYTNNPQNRFNKILVWITFHVLAPSTLALGVYFSSPFKCYKNRWMDIWVWISPLLALEFFLKNSWHCNMHTNRTPFFLYSASCDFEHFWPWCWRERCAPVFTSLPLGTKLEFIHCGCI